MSFRDVDKERMVDTILKMHFPQVEKIQWMKMHPDAIIPTKAHIEETTEDMGYDLHCVEAIDLAPLDITKIPTGIAVKLPYMTGAKFFDRSSVFNKLKLMVGAGVIENNYRGELFVPLYNTTDKHVFFNKGDKIAQMVLLPLLKYKSEEVTEFTDTTNRGTSGFGSTGR